MRRLVSSAVGVVAVAATRRRMAVDVGVGGESPVRRTVATRAGRRAGRPFDLLSRSQHLSKYAGCCGLFGNPSYMICGVSFVSRLATFEHNTTPHHAGEGALVRVSSARHHVHATLARLTHNVSNKDGMTKAK